MRNEKIRGWSVCLLILGLGSHLASAQTTPLSRWIAAPGAAARFAHAATGFSSVNQHLAACLATLAYPDLCGVPGYVNGNPFHEAAYRTNLAAALGQGTANYAGLSGARAGWGYETITHIHDPAKDAEGFIASNQDYAVVSIRGSESGDAYSWFKDWIESDINVGPLSLGSGIVVHGGFWLHAQAVAQHAITQLRNQHDFLPVRRVTGYGGALLLAPNPQAKRPIWVAGHSLGGAAGVLVAYILQRDHGLNVKGVYTIGQPTCGNQGFANDYLARGLQLHRAVNATDFVSRCFADLNLLPLEHSLISTNVGLTIAKNWPAPFDSYLQAMVIHFFTPKILADVGLSLFGSAAQSVGFSPVHFGSLTYFDHSGTWRPTWSTAECFDDRVQAHTADLLAALDPFVFPKPPMPWASLSAWQIYYGKLAEQQGKVIGAMKNPAATIGRFRDALLRVFEDHSAHPDYLRRIHDRTRGAGVNMSGLPGRP